jgi:radical SAM superfamily enzyme YgiQ (UPF0313 family)
VAIEKVFLIYPNYPGSVYPTPVWPQGLGHIAETLKKEGIEYQVLDLRFGYKDKYLFDKIAAFRPQLIGVGMMTSKFKFNYNMINTIKEAFPDISIVVGGPHMSTMKEKVLQECAGVDYGIIGEGEDTIVELCRGDKSFSEIRGLLYRENSQVKYGGDRTRIVELDLIPFPTYEGFEISKYDNVSMNIFSSRGCPFQCVYCCVKLVIGRQWRMRSPKNIVDEMEYWYDKEYRIFNFNDDAFNIRRERVLEICDEIEKRGLRIELNAPNGMRADVADHELLLRMKEVGFKHIALGVEGGNNKVLSNIKKGETIEQIEEAIKNACALDYEVALFFLIGSPGETVEDIEDSFRLAEKYPIVDVRFYNLIPFPNTEMFEWVKKNNYFLIQPEQYMSGNMQWINSPVFETPELGAIQRKKAYDRGLKLGNKLRKRYLCFLYKKGFKKFGIFTKVFAFIASRDSIQFILGKSRFMQILRIFLKNKKLYSRV